jgi:hypothetical protein
MLVRTTTGTQSTSSGASTTATTTTALDLTKRIQKLALERQQNHHHHPSNSLFPRDNNNNNNNQQRLKIVQSDTSSHLSSVKSFEELNLPQDLLHAIYQMGFNRPSYIQEVTLPRILQGRNVIGQAQSGSGKVRYFSSACFFSLSLPFSLIECLLSFFAITIKIQIDDCIHNRNAISH